MVRRCTEDRMEEISRLLEAVPASLGQGEVSGEGRGQPKEGRATL